MMMSNRVKTSIRTLEGEFLKKRLSNYNMTANPEKRELTLDSWKKITFKEYDKTHNDDEVSNTNQNLKTIQVHIESSNENVLQEKKHPESENIVEDSILTNKNVLVPWSPVKSNFHRVKFNKTQSSFGVQIDRSIGGKRCNSGDYKTTMNTTDTMKLYSPLNRGFLKSSRDKNIIDTSDLNKLDNIYEQNENSLIPINMLAPNPFLNYKLSRLTQSNQNVGVRDYKFDPDLWGKQVDKAKNDNEKLKKNEASIESPSLFNIGGINVVDAKLKFTPNPSVFSKNHIKLIQKDKSSISKFNLNQLQTSKSEDMDLNKFIAPTSREINTSTNFSCAIEKNMSPHNKNFTSNISKKTISSKENSNTLKFDEITEVLEFQKSSIKSNRISKKHLEKKISGSPKSNSVYTNIYKKSDSSIPKNSQQLRYLVSMKKICEEIYNYFKQLQYLTICRSALARSLMSVVEANCTHTRGKIIIKSLVIGSSLHDLNNMTPNILLIKFTDYASKVTQISLSNKKKDKKSIDQDNLHFEEALQMEIELKKLLPCIKNWVTEMKNKYYIEVKDTSHVRYKNLANKIKVVSYELNTKKNLIAGLKFPEIEDHFEDLLSKQSTALLKYSPKLRLAMIKSIGGMDMPQVSDNIVEANHLIRESLSNFNIIPTLYK